MNVWALKTFVKHVWSDYPQPLAPSLPEPGPTTGILYGEASERNAAVPRTILHQRQTWVRSYKQSSNHSWQFSGDREQIWLTSCTHTQLCPGTAIIPYDLFWWGGTLALKHKAYQLHTLVPRYSPMLQSTLVRGPSRDWNFEHALGTPTLIHWFFLLGGVANK